MQFKKLVLLAVLFFSGHLLACDIPENCRVKNEKPGYCCWACLETMGRFHGIEPLHDLLEKRKEEKDITTTDWYGNTFVYEKHLGYDFALRNKLTELKVRFWMQDTGGWDRSLLKHAKSHGCLVSVKANALKDMKTPHGIVLTEYNDKNVEYYDPNYPDKIWVGSRKWFDFYWTGMIVVVENHTSKR